MKHKMQASLSSIKVKMSLTLVLVLIATTIIIGVIHYNEVNLQKRWVVEERLETTAVMTLGVFDTIKILSFGMLETVAVLPSVHDIFDGGVSAYYNILALFENMNRYENGIPFYANISIFNTERESIMSVPYDSSPPDISKFEKNINQAFYGNSYVSPSVLSDCGNHLQLLFSTPIIDNYGDVIGIATMLSNTEVLSLFLDDITLRDESFINIIDSEGVIFFSNREPYIGRHVYELRVPETQGSNEMFPHTSGITNIGKYAYISIVEGLNWHVVSFFDADQVDRVAIIEFVISMLRVVGALLLAGIIIVVIIVNTLKPLNELAETAHNVAKGDLNVTVSARKDDEISQVFRSFKEIVDTLNVLYDNFAIAEDVMTNRENVAYTLGDERLAGAYNDMLQIINNIIQHMMRSKMDVEIASKAKSDFLSKMSHEIRTPMNAIKGLTELVLREEIPDTAREHLYTMRNAGEHLLAIINDILDLSKIESGKIEIVEEPYLFHSIINDVVEIINHRMIDSVVKFYAYMEDDVPNALIGDELRIRQILLNILTNATKYTHEGTIIMEVTGKKINDSQAEIVVCIKDTGIGIKPDDLDDLFSEFSQFDLEKNRRIEGTGLGLAITHNLVTSMGGSINVESVYGEGSIFTIILPQQIDKGYEKSSGLSRDSRMRLSRKEYNNEYQRYFHAPTANILIVDDVHINLVVAEGLLKPYEMNVDTCVNGEKSIRMIHEKDYDIVFMDHMMPGMDGFEAVAEIRSLDKFANLTIVALTANALVGAREQFLESGFNDFLSKPIETSKLNNVLLKWIPKEKQKSSIIIDDVGEEIDILIRGVNVEVGIAHSGGKLSNYLDTLMVFRKDCKVKLGQIEGFLKDEDWQNFIIYIHGLKSACANVGAIRLSQKADELEQAGNANNQGFITTHYKNFSDGLTKLIADVDAIISARINPNVEIDYNIIREGADKLKTALEDFDSTGIDEACEMLQPFTVGNENPELSEILQHVFMGMYKQAIEGIEGLSFEE